MLQTEHKNIATFYASMQAKPRKHLIDIERELVVAIRRCKDTADRLNQAPVDADCLEDDGTFDHVAQIEDELTDAYQAWLDAKHEEGGGWIQGMQALVINTVCALRTAYGNSYR